MGFLRRCIEKMSYALVCSLFNVFPLPQKTGLSQSLAFAGESVDRGCSILVFPKGKRTQGLEPSPPFRAGISLLTANFNIPVVPIRIESLFELKKAGQKEPPPGTFSVTIRKAISFAPGTEPLTITRDLEVDIKSL